MTAKSDLDLMTLYQPASADTTSGLKSWSAETFYARFTQRLVAALSAPTTQGELYQVDLQLRPSGTKGPVAVSLAAFESYYAGAAETWESLALTRARVVWATSPAFARRAEAAIETALRRPRDPSRTAKDVLDMRALMAAERPPLGFWDMKLSDGGLVDIEFCAQYLQLIAGQGGGPLRPNTSDALAALMAAEPGRCAALQAVDQAWRLQQSLSQLLKIALEDGADPADEPAALRALLAKAGAARGFAALKRKVAAARKAAHRAFRELVAP
jgi:glutamate-ammonia-ligase adenylyltransferase